MAGVGVSGEGLWGLVVFGDSAFVAVLVFGWEVLVEGFFVWGLDSG